MTPDNESDNLDDTQPTLKQLVAEIESLRREVAELRPDRHPENDAGVRDLGSSRDGTSRRQMFRVAGASAVGLAAGSLMGGSRPAAAADPDDIVKNIPNPVSDTTTLNGSFSGPVLSLFNQGNASTSGALYASSSAGGSPTVRADNDDIAGAGGIAIGGNAPGGRDLVALGSGRIAMNDHAYGNADAYTAGEIHQSNGTVYAMVSPTVRREIVGPTSAGAFHPLTPTRVYDSRRAQPAFGRLNPAEYRVISVADGRNVDTGAVTVAGLVPPSATAIMYNVTAVGTVGAGYLEVAPASALEVASSTINWTESGTTIANASMVAIDNQSIRVFCAPSGSTDVLIDVLGYYA